MAYPIDDRLCIIRHLLLYMENTKNIRGYEMALLISHKQPHKKVSVQTISRWLKQVLTTAGVDTNIFKSHSIRAAATSAAMELDVPMDQILETAGWSREKKFQQFYHKPVVKPGTFAESILSSVI